MQADKMAAEEKQQDSNHGTLKQPALTENVSKTVDSTTPFVRFDSCGILPSIPCNEIVPVSVDEQARSDDSTLSDDNLQNDHEDDSLCAERKQQVVVLKGGFQGCFQDSYITNHESCPKKSKNVFSKAGFDTLSTLIQPQCIPKVINAINNKSTANRKRKYPVDNTTPYAAPANIQKLKLAKRNKLTEIAPTPPSNICLLALPTDDTVLNPVHVFIRKQIEVFEATQADIDQPAPGRKNPVLIKQVGLRCIHCRSLPVKDRTKRAVCYPSSVGRVYNSVSDMKLDHFSTCKGFPTALRIEFENLKQLCIKGKKSNSSPSASSTAARVNGLSTSAAQYYHDTARSIGMVDGPNGVFATKPILQQQQEYSPALSSNNQSPIDSPQRSLARVSPLSPMNKTSIMLPPPTINTLTEVMKDVYIYLPPSLPTPDFAQIQTSLISTTEQSLDKSDNQTQNCDDASKTRPVHPTNGPFLLSSSTDSQYLNPIHCFVRKHIEVFAANEEDVAAPSPGRKCRIFTDQVGIRCIHCAKLPFKKRVKRAVCYPPSIGGIYHCVSNMKFDHFEKCEGLSENDRCEFKNLRSSTGRRDQSSKKSSSSSITSKSLSNSTAQYYHDSAMSLGLVDTKNGIRFASSLSQSVNDSPRVDVQTPATSEETVVTVDEGADDAMTKGQSNCANNGTKAPDGISALMIAANDPSVLMLSTN